MLKKNILVIEDDKSIQDVVKLTLQQANFNVIQAFDGQSALDALLVTKIDLMILDLGLPDIDGSNLLTKIRKTTSVPVLVLTARTEINDKLALFTQGADDYITKPFDEAELVARILAIMKRTYSTLGYGIGRYQSGDLTIDLDKQLVFKGNLELHLTKNEHSLLSLLIQNPQIVLNYATLIQNVWGAQVLATQNETLRVTMANLRRKLGTFAGEQYIGTDIGVGYRWKIRCDIMI